MKDEEIDKMADDFVNAQEFTKVYGFARKAECGAFWKYGFLAGLKAGRPQWHEVTDWKDNSQFPNNELKTYLVRLYQDHYVICELDITEGYRQFYLPDNLEYIDPQDVIAWCEIPTFDKE